jgi:L-ascorbate metabolism protein UlaG (beta-lactamase superfamily)
MKIQKFEQSGFIIESQSGFRIAIDIGNKTPLEKLSGVKPVDIFLVSHVHGDHFDINNIKILAPKQVFLSEVCYDLLFNNKTFAPTGALISVHNTRIPFRAFGVIMKNGFELNAEDDNFKAFHVDHGPNVSVPLEDNFGFLIEVDGKQIYFAGDMYNPSGIDVSELSPDYALLPVGGHYTFGPQEAYEFAKTFKSIGKIIPMHYEKNDHIDPVKKDEFFEIAKNNFDIEVM